VHDRIDRLVILISDPDRDGALVRLELESDRFRSGRRRVCGAFSLLGGQSHLAIPASGVIRRTAMVRWRLIGDMTVRHTAHRITRDGGMGPYGRGPACSELMIAVGSLPSPSLVPELEVWFTFS